MSSGEDGEGSHGGHRGEDRPSVGAKSSGLVREQGGIDKPPFELLGGETKVLAIVERFYDHMSVHEQELARLHPLDEHGQVARTTRDRFGLFFIGWLGGPQDYVAVHGHPRLRRRHAHLAIDSGLRDAWLRSMDKALDEEAVTGPVRDFLDARLSEVADFLRNT